MCFDKVLGFALCYIKIQVMYLIRAVQEYVVLLKGHLKSKSR